MGTHGEVFCLEFIEDCSEKVKLVAHLLFEEPIDGLCCLAELVEHIEGIVPVNLEQ